MFTAAGCSERQVSPSETRALGARTAVSAPPGEEVGEKPTAAVQASNPSSPNAPRRDAPIVSPLNDGTTPANGQASPPTARPATKPPVATTSVSDLVSSPAKLSVKRFAVTSAIEAREPVSRGSSLELGAPIYAFAELASGKGGPAAVEVVFEDASGRKVGHAKLEVPANQPRWRTWGQSRYVDKVGPWTAILLDADRVELARAAFEVVAPEGSRSEPSSPAVTSPRANREVSELAIDAPSVRALENGPTQ